MAEVGRVIETAFKLHVLDRNGGIRKQHCCSMQAEGNRKTPDRHAGALLEDVLESRHADSQVARQLGEDRRPRCVSQEIDDHERPLIVATFLERAQNIARVSHLAT